MSATQTSPTPFAARTIFVLIALSVVGFLSYLLLSAYADELRPAQNGGTHALSNSAVGFAGLADLIKRTHGDVRLVRREADLANDTLLVLTPDASTDPAAVKRILDRRQDLPTMVILPKWIVTPLPAKANWVRSTGTLPTFIAAMPVSSVGKVEIRDAPHGKFRTVSGPTLEAAFEAPDGSALVAYVGDSVTTIVADPDLFNNQGLATVEGAERAMRILSQFAAPDSPVAFDLTLHGFGRNPNLLKLAFEAPFLPLTLCVLLAALLAGWHAMLRFGPAALPDRGVAFGKRALAENGAALLRLARRRHRTGERYATLVREAVATSTGAPPGLTGDALDRYLDRLDREGEPFLSITARAANARDTRGLLAAARDLYHWKRTVTRENR
ncbi:hypothetical protein IAG41_07285 [Sphingomonas sp. JC676]|uniref:DUF4350 domain-containing protein n=1 Tax=Sphingomonas sp. JC676 TaxID=2768065 RepID=UPI001657FB61|nr:DUF4350 domain-containing protein [Sphingomonas sp. JC676]MBC9032190.1 hypothetical protein [Sphingomonas sp. JC676]